MSSTLPPRLPPLERAAMTPAQQAAADELIAGPRKGVKGPFISLLRSPELLARLQKVGEYLRFDNSIGVRLAEFATLVVSRRWTQQFEWAIHVPLALKAGTREETIAALAEGRRPPTMAADEAEVYDFVDELLQHHGVSDATYAAVRERVGEQGVVDLTTLVGYFVTMAAMLNVARTPAEPGNGVAPLEPLPR
jgi:4-carboxymuconolactone decarboxylase